MTLQSETLMSLLRNKGFRFRESGLLCNINYNRARSLKWVKLRRGNFPCDFILFSELWFTSPILGGFASPPLKHRFLLVWDWELIYWPECLGARGVNVVNQQQQINHFSVEIWQKESILFTGVKLFEINNNIRSVGGGGREFVFQASNNIQGLSLIWQGPKSRCKKKQRSQK